MRLVLFGAFVLPLSAAAAQVPVARLDSLFAEYQGTDRPGCSVAVSRNGELIAARGYGMADLSQGTTITPESIFHIASVSKEFTAMTLVLLAQSGQFSLDDDIRKYLPEIPSHGPTISTRHFLTNTSGIRDQWALLMTAGWRLGDDLITEQDVLDILSRQRGVNFAPGTDWLYSNTGFTLAGTIVKRVTGKSLREYAGDVLFRPLGMNRTHFHDDNSMIVRGRTRGYGIQNGEWKDSVPNYSTVGATSLFTTVIDLVQWHRQLDEGTVGGKAALATLLTRAVLSSGDTLFYAMGINHGTYRGQPILSHGGGDPGYRTHVLHFPALKAGVTVFCNLNGANPERLAERTADLYFSSDLAPAKIEGDSAAGGVLAGATGTYWSQQTETVVRVVAADGKLKWGVGPGADLLRRINDRRYGLSDGTTIDVLPNGELEMRSTFGGERSRYVRVDEWTPTSADLAALAGRYTSDEIGVTWDLRPSGDSLMLARRKFAPARLTAVMRDTYTATSGYLPLVIRVQRDKTGRIVGITVGSGRVRRMEFKRSL